MVETLQQQLDHSIWTQTETVRLNSCKVNKKVIVSYLFKISRSPGIYLRDLQCAKLQITTVLSIMITNCNFLKIS